MSAISEVFRTLDNWRHLPAYQLERRVDIFFGLILPEFMEKRFNVSVDTVIPEFPLNKRIICGSDRDQSVRVDFAVFAKGEEENYVFLVELKTDQKTLNRHQLKYMKDAQCAGFYELLRGVKLAAGASPEPRKYAHLIWRLKELGYFEDRCELPKVWAEVSRPVLTNYFQELRVSANSGKTNIGLVVILPNSPDCKMREKIPDGFCCIAFDELKAELKDYSGQLGSGFVKDFLQKMNEWADEIAGMKDPRRN